MEPTLHDKDIILCTTISTFFNKEKSQNNKYAYNSPTLSIDDIVIFKSNNHSGQNWIKRITKVIHQGTSISLKTMNENDVRSIIVGDGSNFVMRNNAFYINGRKSSTYIPHQNFYYVNGDNRRTSYDSRHFGYIPQSSIIATTQLGIFSIHNRKIRFFFTLKRQHQHEKN